MKCDFRNTTMVDATQAPKLFHSAEQPFNRNTPVVESIPCGTIPYYSRVLPEFEQTKFGVRPLGSAFALRLLLPALIQVYQGNRAKFVHDKPIVINCIISSVSSHNLDLAFDVGVSQRLDKRSEIALIGWRDLDMDWQLMNGVTDHMNFVPEPEIRTAVLLLCSPTSIRVSRPLNSRVLDAFGIGPNICAINGDDLSETVQVGFEFRYAAIEGFLNEVFMFGELGNEPRIGGFVGDGKWIDTSDFTESVIVFKGAYQAAYSRDIFDVAYQVAAPEGFYSIALTATMEFAFECLDKFFIVKSVEDSLQLGYNGWNRGLILRKTEFIIERDHLEAVTFLGGLDLVKCLQHLAGSSLFIAQLYYTQERLVNGMERCLVGNSAANTTGCDYHAVYGRGYKQKAASDMGIQRGWVELTDYNAQVPTRGEGPGVRS